MPSLRVAWLATLPSDPPDTSAAPRTQPEETVHGIDKFELLGRLCGYFCDECQTPLAGANLRLYRAAPGGNTTALAVAHPKETFAILSDEQVAEKKSRLLAEAVIGDDGSFRVTLGARRRIRAKPSRSMSIAAPCPSGGPEPPHPRRPVQRHHAPADVAPGRRPGRQAVFDHCLSARYWCAVLAAWACG